MMRNALMTTTLFASTRMTDDMAYTVVRIARSEIVKDVMDFSAAICAADGQMVAQAKTIAQHLGAIPEAMASVLAKFEGDLHDGDVVIMNDPYHGGMHLPDIFIFVPIFFVATGVSFPLATLFGDPHALLLVPVFVLAILVNRGLTGFFTPERVTSFSDRRTSALFIATTLPLVIAVTQIGVEKGAID